MICLARYATTLVLALTVAAPAARADLVTAISGLTVGFDDLIVSPAEPNGPVEVGGPVGFSILASSRGGGLSLGEPILGSWGLGSNGEWSLGKTFAGVDGGVDPVAGAASLVFDFGAPVFAAGGFLNYDPDFLGPQGVPEVLSIAAYDSGGAELESWFLPIWTPGGLNEGAFYGIALNEPLIARFVVFGPYAVIDDLTVAPVPEPSTYALLLFGLVALGLVAAHRRR